ncbi:membrane integrity-associated transporter subunit PqiC [Candidatus Methylospira mobilis]|uniref:Membrane integrity-associated transporter subunit PqiC n=1 Tax=Candidatus Methylospira mobilis TaxID=1808979 RepID=A0A5Q0BL14_9GAMM|nr:PqiC family protein [Candidatus Methylospira mobilis]QFY42807.1 membrane integrity-associated transporter subunit PqiC [Candidatus Methylospira mobilis]WNV03699.1 PqiC family protein [Candidatus Methylospira mobilis]
MTCRLLTPSVLTLLLLLVGCSSPEPHYYVLADSASAAPRTVSAKTEVFVGVGPVDLPEYLDRPQIVTRSGRNELQLAEFDRWAGSLKDNVAQVLAENLRTQLPGNRVALYPWKRAAGIDYQVTVKIIRFDRSVDGDSVLNAHWVILDGEGKQLAAHDAHYAEPPAGSGYRATVAAMNRTLERFGNDVADAIGAFRKAL